MDVPLKERAEIDFWRDSPFENPKDFSVPNIVYKMSEARIFLRKTNRYRDLIASANIVLEIGGGQGWAACILKRLFPKARVIVSDISEHAIASVPRWERLFEVRLDQAIACRSYGIPLEDASVDLAFCFQSAHHFVRQRETLDEVFRILRPGGRLLYLHEPSCRRFLHAFCFWRVNRKRPAVPEDVLVYKDILRFAKEAGFADAHAVFEPSILNRGPMETLYFLVLQRVPALQRVLPTAIDYVFAK